MDIFPTILDLLDLSINTNILKEFDGKSLMPLIKGKATKVRDMFFIENANNLAKAIKKDDYKYIIPVKENLLFFPNNFRHQEELYNLKHDPGERINLIKKDSLESTSYKSLEANLTKWTGKINSTKEESKRYQQLDDEQIKNLKSLGYIQ